MVESVDQIQSSIKKKNPETSPEEYLAPFGKDGWIYSF